MNDLIFLKKINNEEEDTGIYDATPLCPYLCGDDDEGN